MLLSWLILLHANTHNRVLLFPIKALRLEHEPSSIMNAYGNHCNSWTVQTRDFMNGLTQLTTVTDNWPVSWSLWYSTRGQRRNYHRNGFIVTCKCVRMRNAMQLRITSDAFTSGIDFWHTVTWLHHQCVWNHERRNIRQKINSVLVV